MMRGKKTNPLGQTTRSHNFKAVEIPHAGDQKIQELVKNLITHPNFDSHTAAALVSLLNNLKSHSVEDNLAWMERISDKDRHDFFAFGYAFVMLNQFWYEPDNHVGRSHKELLQIKLDLATKALSIKALLFNHFQNNLEERAKFQFYLDNNYRY